MTVDALDWAKFTDSHDIPEWISKAYADSYQGPHDDAAEGGRLRVCTGVAAASRSICRNTPLRPDSANVRVQRFSMLAGTSEKNRFLSALAPPTRPRRGAHDLTRRRHRRRVARARGADRGAVVSDVGDRLTLRPLDNEINVEVDASGAEGFLGGEILLGARSTPDTWVVQSPGRFARLDAAVFLEAVERDARCATPDPLPRRGRRGARAVGRVQRAAHDRTAAREVAARDARPRRRRDPDHARHHRDDARRTARERRQRARPLRGRWLVAHGYARVRIVNPARLLAHVVPLLRQGRGVLRAGLAAA